MQKIKVIIADDHSMVREALADHIEQLPFVKD